MAFDPLEVLLAFGSTFSGVLIAFYLTLWDERTKNRQREDEDRKNVLRTIRDEVSANLVSAGNVKSSQILMGPGYASFLGLTIKAITPSLIVKLRRAAFDTAVHSGNFVLLIPDLRTKISDQYLLFDYITTISAEILDERETESVQWSRRDSIQLGIWPQLQ